MREIEAIGKAKNCYYIMFVSGAQRKAAHQFYAALGYNPAGPFRFFDTNNLMTIALIFSSITSSQIFFKSLNPTYVPQPLQFADSPDAYAFGISADKINENLDYLVETLERNGHIRPSWAWNRYPEAWEIARLEWPGILTLNALIILDKFQRIKGCLIVLSRDSPGCPQRKPMGLKFL